MMLHGSTLDLKSNTRLACCVPVEAWMEGLTCYVDPNPNESEELLLMWSHNKILMKIDSNVFRPILWIWSSWPALRSVCLWILWFPTIWWTLKPKSMLLLGYLYLLFEDLYAFVFVLEQVSDLLHPLALSQYTYISLKEYYFFYFFFSPIPRVILETLDILETFDVVVGEGPSSVSVFLRRKSNF